MQNTDEVVPVILVMNEENWLPYCLESVKGRFGRYVIYDVGSEDRTRDIISWFIDTEGKNAKIVYRKLPFVEPIVQGTFRNSMIADALADWYMILDGDELYTPKSLDSLILEMENMKNWYIAANKTYGIARRVEVAGGMKEAYGQDLNLSHHRIYHRKMTWEGTHPGEEATVTQNKRNEHWFSKDVICYHFHNCKRSSLDEKVPKRMKRRTQGTYHRGELTPIDILDILPILQKRIEDFPVCPELENLWEKSNDKV